MSKHVVLLKFTDKGVSNIKDSAERAHKFDAYAEAKGIKILSQYWTTGPYDGVLVIEAPDEKTGAGAVLHLGKLGSVSTCMLSAYDEKEFKDLLARSE